MSRIIGLGDNALAETTKVLIIDDHPLFRAALEVALVKSKINPKNIQTASSITDALDTMNKTELSLLLLDLNLSDSQDFEGLSKIRAVNETIPIIIVSATESAQAYQTAASLGASGYIPKSSSLNAISQSIASVLAGKPAFPKGSELTDEDGQSAQKLGSLTPAQHRVMSCLSDGLLNKQIAFKMGISEATVKAHMTAIFRKLGANNRTQALLVFRDAVRL